MANKNYSLYWKKLDAIEAILTMKQETFLSGQLFQILHKLLRHEVMEALL